MPFAKWFGALLLHAVMLVLLVSGLEKAAKIDDFQVVMTGWTILPSGAIKGLSHAIVNGQLLISLGWFLRLWPQTAVLSGLLLLMLYTSGFVYQLQSGEPPECHCVMLMDQFFQGQEKAKYTIIRNMALIVCLAVGMILWLLARSRGATPIVIKESGST